MEVSGQENESGKGPESNTTWSVSKMRTEMML